MIASYLTQHKDKMNDADTAIASSLIETIAQKGLCDDDIIFHLTDAIANHSLISPNDVISCYCRGGKERIEINESSIEIDGHQVREADIVSVQDEGGQFSVRLNKLKSITQKKYIKCCFPKCPRQASLQKIQIDCEPHLPSCVYCFQCFRKLGIYYMNKLIYGEKSDMAWNCICKNAIPKKYFMPVISDLLDNYYAIKVRSNICKFDLFCMDCGDIVTVSGSNKGTEIRCNRHAKVTLI